MTGASPPANLASAHTAKLRPRPASPSNGANPVHFLDHSPLGLLWVEPRGLIRRANKAGLELLGCAPADCVNRPVQSFHSDPEAATHALRRLARRGVLHNHRAQLRGKNGAVRHVLIDADGLWERGRMVYSQWFLRDITRRVELEREILVIAERERQRIGRDLHDDLCQQLAGIEFLSQTLAGQLFPHSRADAERAREIARMIRQAINHTRELAHGLSSAELETRGLPGALQELARRSRQLFRIDCRFRARSVGLNPDPGLGIHLYRIAQEAVANALKHGQARRVEISLARHKDRLVLTVKDDGIGMPRRTHPGQGMGLRLMQYRAGVIGGTLAIARSPGRGTAVSCSVSRLLANSKTSP